MSDRDSRYWYRRGALRVITLLEEGAAREHEPIAERLRRIAHNMRTALGAASALVGDDPAEVEQPPDGA